MHFVVRFQPKPGQAEAFRAVLLAVIEPSRAEPGCLAFYAFESLREPIEFGIHSEWLDEAAFEQHAREPHTVRFIEAAERLLTHPVQGLRSHVLGGGPGAGAMR